MRVIAGTLRGRTIDVPRSGRVRPTYDRVRESVFAIIEPRLEGASVLDLFAGSGSLGIEALSRGARRATFVEIDRGVARVVERNLERLGVSGSSDLRLGDALRTIEFPLPGAPFDVVFVDPPYESGLRRRALAALAESGRLVKRSLVVVERPAGDEPPDAPEGLELLRTRRYGSTAVDFYRTSESGERPDSQPQATSIKEVP
ncbi:MAG: 16S rRNA (guanine(966)-N(2))-methyltransferase RsmD [Candidatus Eisenbacteria bacterium]|nr:16S rRNA (guanine(966)-N(2))-methyltransferase RsmD [Candidatus Eisenbacteria bacterium]